MSLVTFNHTANRIFNEVRQDETKQPNVAVDYIRNNQQANFLSYYETVNVDFEKTDLAIA